MIEVYLARHGQTEENISRIFQGHLPGRLTEEGKRQAVELGEKLKDIELDAIVSSDLQRVADTVRLAMAGRPLPWKQTALLREIDWGSWTGLPIQSVDLEKQPEDAGVGSSSWADQPFPAGANSGYTDYGTDFHSAHAECGSPQTDYSGLVRASQVVEAIAKSQHQVVGSMEIS